MSPDRQPPHAPRRWALRSSWGELAFAGLLVAVASGVALALPYDAQRPYESLAWLLLANPAGAFFRNLHYWAGQLFLVLTVFHAWSHLSRWTETRVPRRVWWRTTASLPLAAFVMLSGFMLKGDAEALQALRIVTALLDQVPWAGRLVSVAVFGTEGHRQILYVHHVASASMFLWVFIAEHARAMWPRLVAVVETLAPVAILSLFVSPALHDGLDPIVKGPWYFLGLQEMLHWTTRPALVVAAAVALVAVVVVVPRLSDRSARAAKGGLVAALAIYALFTVVGVAFRGPNWALAPVTASWQTAAGWRSSGLVLHGLGPWWTPPIDRLVAGGLPSVLGRPEGCLACHRDMKGLSRSHGAEAVGCASCHGGNPFSLDRITAHAGLVRVPGNLASASRACGTPACHPSQVERVSRSLMTTMAGIVSVDRAAWGGREADAKPARVDALGRAGADGHLRQLCASCHLGAEKTGLGPIGEESRGGGCAACHLKYSPEARVELARYQRDLARAAAGRNRDVPVPPRTHPDVSIAIDRGACFGCHSRSGRISTNYEGWHELDDRGVSRGASSAPAHSPVAPGRGAQRRLADGRVFVFVAPDLHARNMECIDCHASREVMGDGVDRAREHEAVRVACLDCHRPRSATPVVASLDALDTESRRIAGLRGRGQPGERFLATADGGYPLLNTGVDAQGVWWLAGKLSGQRLTLKPPAAVCVEGAGHARLSCISCHAAWAPRCPRCHTAFDPGREAVDLLDGRTTKGAWVETPGEFNAEPPTLGIVAGPAGQARRGTVDTFIPGMVMTLDRNQVAGSKPDTVFRRFYARSFSHTVGRSARSCQSCHADPVALGYGEGTLRFEREGERGRWRFTPRFPAGPDGLPADAWIGFLQDRTTAVSTRADARPFTVEEQKRILTVGACLTCHEPARIPIGDFRALLARVSTRCVLPAW